MKIVKRIIIILLLVVAIVGGIFIYNGYSMYKDALKDTTIEETISKIQQTNSYTKLEDMPEYYYNAVVAVEDHRFYDHGAIDIISICRAIVNNIKEMSFVEGGSTITQQLAKNVFFNQEKELTRKIAEVFMANDLENKYDKDEILELYINTSYFGDGYYGIKQASNGYYEKEPKDLNLYEATLLAGVPNAPSVYAPTQNIDLAHKRQQVVISKMVEHGYITETEAANILSEVEVW